MLAACTSILGMATRSDGGAMPVGQAGKRGGWAVVEATSGHQWVPIKDGSGLRYNAERSCEQRRRTAQGESSARREVKTAAGGQRPRAPDVFNSVTIVPPLGRQLGPRHLIGWASPDQTVGATTS